MIDPDVVKIYSQRGGDLPYFVGGHQDGVGWLRSIGRFAFPILKRLFNVAQNTAEDVLVREKPILSSLGRNAMGEVEKFVSGKGVPAIQKRRGRRGRRRLPHKKYTIPPIFGVANNNRKRRGRKKRRRL